MKRDIARELYKAYKTQPRKFKKIIRDDQRSITEPQSLAEVFDEIIENRDWRQGLAEGNLFSDWEKIVGGEVAQHSTPITILDGVLTIQTSSTSWATQLRLMNATLLQTIQKSAPGATVEEILVIGPNTPSWKRGLRTIRGARGPRDTYG